MQFLDLEQESFSGLDITPLVDTVFNLLIFFALSLNFVVTPALHVDLPEASSGAPLEEVDRVTIELNAQGEVVFNGVPVSLEELQERLGKVAQTDPETFVIVQADTNARHGRVIEVIDTVERSGFTQIGIAVAHKENSP